MALGFVFLDRRGFVVGGSRGRADRLPEGRFAVPDPDDGSRLTFWRVESTNRDGSRKELRPWPPDVRWAPWRPDYPEGLDAGQRREWSQRWYDEVYFGWKEQVIEAIAADPQGAADEFARSAPDADLPSPVKKRPRQQVRRPRPVSAKQRQIAAERLMVEALRRVGMSERDIAAELLLPKTTVHRRLVGEQVVDGVALLMAEVRVASLVQQVTDLARQASPEDVPALRERVEQIQQLQARIADRSAGVR